MGRQVPHIGAAHKAVGGTPGPGTELPNVRSVSKRASVMVVGMALATPLLIAATAGPASATILNCTLGYPTTLSHNPNNPLGVTVNPLTASGPVNYSVYVVDATFGYTACAGV